MNRSSDRVRQNFKSMRLSGGLLAVSTIIVHELWFGVNHSERVQENASRLRKFLAQEITILPFSDQDAESAAQTRARLKATGTPIGAYDTLIAGQALARGFNAGDSEYAGVCQGGWIEVEDWTI
jgi:tRNA(fMet)-specific endonuclease VapC